MNEFEMAQAELAAIERAVESRTQDLKRLHLELTQLRHRAAQVGEYLRLREELFGKGRPEEIPYVSEHIKTELGPMAQLMDDQKRRLTVEALRARGSARQGVADSAAEIIRVFGPRSTRELVQMLQQQGVEIPGADTQASLAVILNRDKRFFNDRAQGGWVLKALKGEDPSGGGTPDGSSE